MSAKRVLIIDDDDDIRALLEVLLNVTEGWDVMTAASGPRGIALAGTERPDAILLDVMMPGMDGVATLEGLRAGATRDIPVIFFTAKAQEEFSRLLSFGAQGVIGKPFDPDTLGTEIRDLLGWL